MIRSHMIRKVLSMRMVFVAVIVFSFILSIISVLADESFYIFDDSDEQELMLVDLEERSLQELNYGRNEIYARHGRIFKSKELDEYFSSQNWYQGTIAPEDFSEDILNDIEKRNVEFLYSWEHTQYHPDGYVLDQPGYNIENVYRACYYEKSYSQDTVSDIESLEYESQIIDDSIAIDSNYGQPVSGKEVEEEKTYTILFNSSITGPNMPLTFVYSDSLFSGSANTFSKKLAVASISLASAAYSEAQSRDILKELGFEDIYQGNYKEKATMSYNDFAAYNIGCKEITINGLNKNLVIVTVRGTTGNYEWYSNFNIDNTADHKGFYKAAAEIEEAVVPYLEKGGIDSNILWITGHSRGASISNILAGRFSLDYGDLIDSRHVYGYTFAPASVSLNADTSLNNIFNFCNPGDVVTQVPLNLWGYKRFGKDVECPDKNTLKENFTSLTGLKYDGFLTRQSVVSKMEKWAPTVDELCEKKTAIGISYRREISKQDVLKAMATFLVKDKDPGDTELAVNLLSDVATQVNIALPWGIAGAYLDNKAMSNLSTFIVDWERGSFSLANGLAHSHCQELYYSWATLMDEEEQKEEAEYTHFDNNLIEKNFPFTGSFYDASDWLQANGYEFSYETNDEMRPCISFENPDKPAWHLEVLQLDPEKEYGLIVKAKDRALQDPIDWTRAEEILTDEITFCFGGKELVNGFLESNGYSVYIGNGFYQISSASALDTSSQDTWQAAMPVSGDSEEEWQAATPVTDVQEQIEQEDNITANMDYDGMSFCLRSNVYSGKWVNDDGQLIIDGGKLEAHFGKTAENNYEYHFYGSYQGSYDLGTDGFWAYTIPEGGGKNNSFNIILLNGVLRITAQHPEDENVLGKGKVCQYYPAESAGEKTFWERSETATMDPLGTKVSETSEKLSTPVIMEIIRHHIQYNYMDSGYNDWDVYMYGRKTEDDADKAFFIINGYREDGLEEAFNYTVTFIQNNGWWLDEIEVLEANDTPFYS